MSRPIEPRAASAGSLKFPVLKAPEEKASKRAGSTETRLIPSATATSDALDNILAAPNPFVLPKDDLFTLRENEKIEREEARQMMRSMTLWDKTKTKTQPTVTHRALSKTAPGQEVPSVPKPDRMFHGRRREKENMTDLISKKREMFLMQMSLDTKKQEILKLEEKAAMKEDALRKSEMMLEEDAMRFDTFLKENDKKAHEALKRADDETKQKQEKVAEIKKLNQAISKVENEIAKYEEQLSACIKYKQFLDMLTPPEHLEKVKKKKEEARKQRELAKHAAGGSTSSRVKAAVKRRASKVTDNGKSEPNSDEEDSDAASDSDDMYFKKPEQLLQIFTQLEERNLFLIQNVQETEEALEELKQKYKETELQMEEGTQKLAQKIADLTNQIKMEEEKASALKKRTRASAVAGHQQELLQSLNDKVRSVYLSCGFDKSQTDTVDMLREIENYLEYLLNKIASMDPVKVAEAEKRKENERRNRVREAKKEEKKRQYEERLAKSTARANAEVVKRTGKPIMHRSAPVRKKKKREETQERDEEAEDYIRFFT